MLPVLSIPAKYTLVESLEACNNIGKNPIVCAVSAWSLTIWLLIKFTSLSPASVSKNPITPAFLAKDSVHKLPEPTASLIVPKFTWFSVNIRAKLNEESLWLFKNAPTNLEHPPLWATAFGIYVELNKTSPLA